MWISFNESLLNANRLDVIEIQNHGDCWKIKAYFSENTYLTESFSTKEEADVRWVQLKAILGMGSYGI